VDALGSVGVSGIDRDLLMELQYRFPLTPTPIVDVAERLGVKVSDALARLKRLNDAGILKRIGFYYNYKAQGHVAALVAFAAGKRFRVLADVFKEDPLVTHSFLRDHPVYNVWIVAKRRTMDELLDYVRSVAHRVGIDRWIVLFSKRTFKLSVKYDLYEGISRAGEFSRVVENPPSPEDLGIDPRLPRMVRVLEISERPYRKVASSLGMSEDEVVDTVKELLMKGVLSDPGAALDGHRIGFRENAMVVMEPVGDEYEACECAAEIPYSTHVVLRGCYPEGAWRHTCYFMVHAVSRDKVERVVKWARDACPVKDVMPIYSLEDLKPGVVR
jgi:DNA-binding Lrp family transcriptional regulator